MIGSRLVGRAASAAVSAKVLTTAGVVRPHAPWTLATAGRALLRWGLGPAGGLEAQAIRAPRATALVDDLGPLTFADLRARSNAVARALTDRGVVEGDRVAVLCRNHRGFLDATFGAAKVGADVVLLNTSFGRTQLQAVLDRDRPSAVLHDEEFGPALDGLAEERRVLTWSDGPGAPDPIGALAASYSTRAVPPPQRQARLVILTSGTTGAPRGAARSEAGLEAAVALLDRIPLRYGGRTHIAAPLFHTWGFAHLALGLLLSTTVVLRRRFDAEDCLAVLERERCDAAAVVPVLLQRILRLPPEVTSRHDLARVRVVASSGSALPGDLATEWMDRFGDHLYNVYGSTEVGYGTIATPGDLRAAPSSAGRPPLGAALRIVDADGRTVPRGATGRVLVGGPLQFDGYTSGGSREVIDGLMATGDLGHIGPDGRLYLDGREDDLIVSGGENVAPQPVEDCLSRHPGVRDVVVVGVPDDQFGQRLRAFVVRADDALTSESLLSWARERLSRFEMPREVVFVDDLPRNATGKVVRRDLPGAD